MKNRCNKEEIFIRAIMIFVILLFSLAFTEINILPQDTLLRNIAKTNLDYDQEPLPKSLIGKLKRWNIDEPIPIFTSNDERIEKGISAIQSKLEKTIFNPISSADEVLSDTRGIIVSLGTALGKSGKPEPNALGHVSNNPYTTSWYNHTLATGEISSVMYVNLDSATGTKAPHAVALHELGHALGMFDHFDGFDDQGDAWSDNAWQVLINLYNNPILANETTLKVSSD